MLGYSTVNIGVKYNKVPTENKFGKFLKKMHKTYNTYADWQNEKYSTKIDRSGHIATMVLENGQRIQYRIARSEGQL